MEFCIGALTDETRALNTTISTFIIELFSHARVLVCLPRYCYTVRNQPQLLMHKFQNGFHNYSIFKKLLFRIIIKNLTKCNILSTFAFKHYGKFADYNSEKIFSQSLASTLTILSLASRGSVLEKAVLGLGFFSSPRPWPRTLCPRLYLWLLVQIIIVR